MDLEKTLQDFLTQVGGNGEQPIMVENVDEENFDHIRQQMDEDIREDADQANGDPRFSTDQMFEENRKEPEYF